VSPADAGSGIVMERVPDWVGVNVRVHDDCGPCGADAGFEPKIDPPADLSAR
jgi:hypothetical protein